ncbi:MAG: hypothetical protein WCO90_10945 [Planctomycetota bacterium]|jgi:hypothetical protein
MTRCTRFVVALAVTTAVAAIRIAGSGAAKVSSLYRRGGPTLLQRSPSRG